MVTIQVVTAARAARPSKEMPESLTVNEKPALLPNPARTLTITIAERAVTIASQKERPPNTPRGFEAYWQILQTDDLDCRKGEQDREHCKRSRDDQHERPTD